jgi:pyruvate ferredoxin oxidoreductase alpha subunit
MRAEGERVGLLRIGAFRPFPADEVRAALAGVRAVTVLDRAVSPGAHPPLLGELAACLYGGGVHLRSCVYGLGGRDLDPTGVRAAFDEAGRKGAPGDIRYLGLRS